LLQASSGGYGNGKRSSQLGKKQQSTTYYASKQYSFSMASPSNPGLTPAAMQCM